MGGSILHSIIAQGLTPTNPALETAAMALSLVAVTLVLTTGTQLPHRMLNAGKG